MAGWDAYTTGCTPWRVHSLTIDVWFKMYINTPGGPPFPHFGGIAGMLFDKAAGGAVNN